MLLGALLASGQVSVETLMVFLIFLILLGIAYTAASKIGTQAQQKISRTISQSSFDEFSSKLEQACTLGNGNVRTIEIKGTPAQISAQENTLYFEAKGFSSSKKIPCQLSILQDMPSSSFTIENIEGTIEIS